MKLIFSNATTEYNANIVNDISLACGITKDTACLLVSRNVNSVEKAKRFLSPGKHGFYDPFLLNGMSEAVERIKLAKEYNQNVLIFGDYDADGICASTVLYYSLKKYGLNVTCMIPEREDGYGLSLTKIEDLAMTDGLDLVITVDCGISDREAVGEIMDAGIDVIVTDHHEPPEILPETTLINPKLSNQEYPFNGLCGAGVAYKLAYAVIGDLANNYLDLVALATVADSMELIDENRDIVYEGLKIINTNLRQEFKLILGDNVRTVTAQSIAYGLAPRINAGGRMGDANTALRLFITDSITEKTICAEKLCEYNVLRQAQCDNIYKEAKALILQNNLINDEVIMVYNKNWSIGLIGIVAARLVEEYSRPVIIFAEQDGLLKGSARSAERINIHEVISSAQGLINSFGGHAQAAGVSVSEENFELLKNALNTYIKNNYAKYDKERTLNVEWVINEEVSLGFAKEIELLEPFGVGNKKPLFVTEIYAERPVLLKSGASHYSFKTNAMEMLYFNSADKIDVVRYPAKKQVVFEINHSVYKGKSYVKGYVKSIIPSYTENEELSLFVLENELLKLTQRNNNITVEKIHQNNNVSAGYGSLYAITDIANISRYSVDKGVLTSLFKPDETSSLNTIVISPKVVPEGYKKVIYLDAPLTYINTQVPSYVLGDEVCRITNGLDCSRQFFADAYNQLKTLVGKEYYSSAEFAIKYSNGLDSKSFVFAMLVFLELGIFYVRDNILRIDLDVKSALTNSVIYNTIYNR